MILVGKKRQFLEYRDHKNRGLGVLATSAGSRPSTGPGTGRPSIRICWKNLLSLLCPIFGWFLYTHCHIPAQKLVITSHILPVREPSSGGLRTNLGSHSQIEKGLGLSPDLHDSKVTASPWLYQEPTSHQRAFEMGVDILCRRGHHPGCCLPQFSLCCWGLGCY